MLSFGFWELVVVGTIALVVIGPKRLPEAARFFGHFFRRITRQVNSVKADIKREIALEDMKHIHKEFQEASKNVGNVFQTETQKIQENLNIAPISINNNTDELLDDKQGDSPIQAESTHPPKISDNTIIDETASPDIKIDNNTTAPKQ